MLVAENLWRHYDGKPALKGLDLTVEAGSAYGFIGPNGAGKSTTLRILATVDRPDAGRVWINGRDAQHHARWVRPRLGFMPDPFNLYDELTVGQLLRFFARAYRLPPAEQRRRVDRAIELTKIGERRRDRCGKLSRGWRQRVLLAKTLINDPLVLLLDEPASGLDPAARIEFRDIVRTLKELKKTVVVSSHILTELADFCDSVGIIERGRMLVSGRIADILERLDPHDRLELEVVHDDGRAAELLGARDDVERVDATAGDAPGTVKLTVGLIGRCGPEKRAALLRELVEQGVAVSSLAGRREGLEELFLRVAGKLGGEEQRLSSEMLRTLLGPGRKADS